MELLFKSVFPLYDIIEKIIKDGYVVEYIGFQGSCFINSIKKEITTKGEEIVVINEHDRPLVLDIHFHNELLNQNPENDRPVLIKEYKDGINIFILDYDYSSLVILEIDLVNEEKEKFLTLIKNRYESVCNKS